MSTHTWTSEGERYEVGRDGQGDILFKRNDVAMGFYREDLKGRQPIDSEVHHAALAELLSLAERLAEAEERERWIPVEERLPEHDPEHESRWVLVWCEAEGCRWCSVACRVRGVEGWRWELRSGRLGRVAITHWRELPPGPK